MMIFLIPEASSHDQGGDHAGEQAHGSDKDKRDDHVHPLHFDGIGANDHVGRVATEAQPPELLLAQA